MLNGHEISIKLYADGANIEEMKEAYAKKIVSGFTTNPTLMRKAGISDYVQFAQEAIKAIPDMPISFEVFSDEFDSMEKEARFIGSWGDNVFIKIPVTNTKGESSVSLIRKLSSDGLKLNVTAILTLDQVEVVGTALNPLVPSIVSVFAGRIADTGVDPVPTMKRSAELLGGNPQCELLWASTRELLNIFQAQDSGCHIITATNDILKKLSMLGKDLTQLSLETVTMFYKDASSAGFTLI